MDIVTRLKQLAHAVADEDWSEFSMRVPADSERDADLVLLRASKEIESLHAELAECKRDAEIVRFLRCGGWEVLQDPKYWTEENRFYGAIEAAMIDVSLAAKGE